MIEVIIPTTDSTESFARYHSVTKLHQAGPGFDRVAWGYRVLTSGNIQDMDDNLP